MGDLERVQTACPEDPSASSEARWKFVIQASGFGAWEINLKNERTWRSARHDEIFGYATPAADWTYAIFLQHVIEDERGEVDRLFQLALHHRDDIQFECRIRRVDNDIRWIRVSGKRLSNGEGDDCIYGLVEDVTDRKRAENALFASEARFRKVFESNVVGMIRWDLESNLILEANDEFLRMTGYSRSDVDEGRINFRALTPPEWTSRNEAALSEIKDQGFAAPYEKEYYRKDGSRVPLIIAGTRFPDSLTGGMSVIIDISEQKDAEAKVRTSERRLQRAIDAANLTYSEIDMLEGRVWTADNYMKVTGYEPPSSNPDGADIEEAMDCLRRHVPAADLLRVETAFATFSKGEPEGLIEYRIVGDDLKTRWMEAIWSTEIAADNTPVRAFSTSMDITKRKAAEEQVHLLMAEVNHRSKNLLSVVQAIAHQTARSTDPDAFATVFSERIQGLAANQDLLVKNQWKNIEVADLIASQLSHLTDMTGTRVSVGGPSAYLSINAAQGIGMALHELATNAAKYGSLSNETGLVEINWSLSSSVPASFSMEWREEGGPTVDAPKRRGFGSIVIGRMVEAATGGKVLIEYRDTGFFWRLTAPIEGTIEPKA